MKAIFTKKLGFTALMLVLLLALAACGKSAADTPAASGAAAASPAASEAAKATAAPADNEKIVYKAANGDVEIPKHPKRIVLLADYFGYFQILGITPVGATNYTFENPFYEGKLNGVTNIGDGTNAEKILALQPDLILTWNAEGVPAMSKIAPTVLIEYGKLSYKDQLREFGRMTDTLPKAEAWISSWESKIAQVKPQVQAAVGEKTISIVQTDAKNIYVFGDKFGRGGEIMYGELGLKSTALTKTEAIDKGPGYTSISLEKLPEFVGDYVFTSTWQMTSDGSQTYESSVWKNLPAVKAGKVFQIHPIGWYFNDPISMEGQLDFIVKSLTAK